MRKRSHKPCVVEGCKNKPAEGYRYCSFHGEQIATALRKSPTYWRHDQPSTEDGNGGIAAMNLD